MMLTSKHFKRSATVMGLTYQDVRALQAVDWAGMMNVAEETNQNLTAPQRELKLWHDRLGHADMQRIQTICRKPSARARSTMRTNDSSNSAVPSL